MKFFFFIDIKDIIIKYDNIYIYIYISIFLKNKFKIFIITFYIIFFKSFF